MKLLKLGTLALDGTKVHANASRHSALSYGHAEKLEAQLRAEVKELSNGQVRYELKTPYRDGTTHVIIEPMDCAPGKAALILQVKVLSWKVKLAPLSNESCAAAGNFRGEA